MMSGNDTSATTTLTSTDVAAVSASASNEQEDSPTLTPDCNESANMDLANGPNPWLPAYGFQLQHHSQFQPTHLEDLRANGLYTLYLFPLFLSLFSFSFFSHTLLALSPGVNARMLALDQRIVRDYAVWNSPWTRSSSPSQTLRTLFFLLNIVWNALLFYQCIDRRLYSRSISNLCVYIEFVFVCSTHIVDFYHSSLIRLIIIHVGRNNLLENCAYACV